MDLKNKTILITGATTGIGLATAKLLSNKGANIIIYSKSIPKTPDIDILKKQKNILIIKGDITKKLQVQNTIKKALKKFRKIDFLINNAAISTRNEFIKTTPKDWKIIFDINVFGTLTTTQEVLKAMVKQGSGTIVNIASGAGIYGIEELSLYSMTKAAMINLSQSLQDEVKKYGIKIFTITPGSTDTKMFKECFPKEKAYHRPEQVAEIIYKSITKEIKPDKRLIVDVFHHAH